MKIVNLFLVSLLLTICSTYSYAQTRTSTTIMQATATLNATCTLTSSTINNIIFGQVTPVNQIDVNITGGLEIACNNGISYTIALSAGNSNDMTRRIMRSASGDTLEYNLYTDTTYSKIAGDGNNGSVLLVDCSGNNCNTSSTGLQSVYYPVYAKLFNSQYVKPDSYTDNISVTINY